VSLTTTQITNATFDRGAQTACAPASVKRELLDRCPTCGAEFDMGWTIGDDNEAVAFCKNGHDHVVKLSDRAYADAAAAFVEQAFESAEAWNDVRDDR